jgi:hypothetical protein
MEEIVDRHLFLFEIKHFLQGRRFTDFRKLYVTKSDFLIDVDNLHCLYNTHKFHIRQVDSIFTVISKATRSYP